MLKSDHFRIEAEIIDDFMGYVFLRRVRTKAREEQHHGAATREKNQERRGQHEPRDDGGGCGKSGAKITIEGAGARIPDAMLKQLLVNR